MTASVQQVSSEAAVGTLVLCRTEYVHPPYVSGAPEFAKLRPLFQGASGHWAAVDNRRSAFPDEGLVFWWRPPAEVRNPALVWRVTTASQPKYDGNRNLDRLQVKEGCGLVVEEWYGAGASFTDDQLRFLLENGVELSKPPIGKMVFPLEGGLCVGPLELALANGRWICTDNDVRSRIPVRPQTASSLARIVEEGRQHVVLAPNAELASPTRFLNAQSSLEVLHGLLKRVRRIDQRTYEALGVTYKAYDAFLDALARAELPGDQALIERARADRLKKVVDGLKSDESVLREIVQTLMAMPEAASRIDSAVDAEIKRRISEAESAIEQQLERRRGRIGELDKEIAAKQRELDSFPARVAAAEAEAMAKGEGLKEAMSRALREMVDGSANVIAQHAVFEALSRRPDEAGPEQPARTSPPVTRPVRQALELADIAAARVALSQRLGSSDVSVFAAGASVAASLAGFLPLVHGPCADALAVAVADTFADGRLLRVSVPATTYQVQDLFVKFDPATGRSADVPGALSSVLGEYPSDALVVVLLEGVNRAPLEAYLPLLLESVATAGTGDRQARIPIGNVGEGGTFEFAWPGNVILLGTLVAGPAAFPVPQAMLDQLVLIPTWIGPSVGEGAEQEESKMSHLALGQWEKMRDAVRKSRSVTPVLSQLPSIPSLSKQGMQRLVNGLENVFGSSGALPIALALATRWIPAAESRQMKEWISKVGADIHAEWAGAAAGASEPFVWKGTLGGGSQ